MAPFGPTPDKAQLGPPPRWFKCPRKGFTIANRFVAFKTPLCDLYDSQVPEMYRFYPRMILDSAEKNVGLWIDLTNTDRFYFKEDVELEGVRYLKVKCRGHGESPSEEQTRAFVKLCRDFWSDHPRQLLAVHCTHGFNRTGFLICAYLVEQQDWSIEAAVAEFAKCRPPGIYKEDYLRELFRRYGDEEDTPSAPELPDWCGDNDVILTDQETEAMNSNGNPTTSNAPLFMDGQVPGVSYVSDNGKRVRMQRLCQHMCRWKKNGFPGSQPVSMEASKETNNLSFLAKKAYKVSWKADGVRYMMLLNGDNKEGQNEVFMFDRDHNCFQVPNMHFPHRKEQSRSIKETLLDGEMIIDEHDGQSIPRYLIYDIVLFEGNDVGSCDFGRRLFCIDREIVKPRYDAMSSGMIDRSKEPFSVRAKQFWDVTAVEKILGEKFSKNLSHEIDGLIFQPVKDPYFPGRCDQVLKWKPPHLNSVDFKLQITKEKKEGMLPEWKGHLYVLHLDRPFADIKMTKQLKQYDKKIIECSFDKGQWVFMRERTDKSFPNAFTTARGVCNSINYPITKEILLEFIRQKAVKPRVEPAPEAQANGKPKREAPMPPPDYVPPKKQA